MRRYASWRRRTAVILVFLLAGYAGLAGLRLLYPVEYTDRLIAWSREFNLDPALVAAVVRCESRFHADAVSPRGAIGLMQIMPETGAWIADQLDGSGYTVDQLYDPEVNLWFGTWYLRFLLDRFEQMDDALAAYNAGPSRVAAWQAEESPRYPETATYVDRVKRSVTVYRWVLSVPWLVRITPSLLP